MAYAGCHEAWPKLDSFGQLFKDNGYQMGNDRDAPIFQQPAYWPVSFRMTPHWHRVSVDHADISDPATGNTIEGRLTTHGFALSGMQILTSGTAATQISFLLLPASQRVAVFRSECSNV